MDEIQKVLVKAGRKDLAQKYFEKWAGKDFTEEEIKILQKNKFKKDGWGYSLPTIIYNQRRPTVIMERLSNGFNVYIYVTDKRGMPYSGKADKSKLAKKKFKTLDKAISYAKELFKERVKITDSWYKKEQLA